MRYETGPGERAQADWGQASYIEDGRERKLYFLALTLGHSRPTADLAAHLVDPTAFSLEPSKACGRAAQCVIEGMAVRLY